ncbi:GGDEF domain-containing protein [Parasalinivibrio latis]|uniref:GGDEF domain-containing protein n=1 Tax=Parasalinivibrio latis TaxID=2952610 RepID=UPI0030E0C991
MAINTENVCITIQASTIKKFSNATSLTEACDILYQDLSHNTACTKLTVYVPDNQNWEVAVNLPLNAKDASLAVERDLILKQLDSDECPEPTLLPLGLTHTRWSIPLRRGGELFAWVIATFKGTILHQESEENLSIICCGIAAEFQSHILKAKVNQELTELKATEEALNNSRESQKGLLEQLRLLHDISFRLWRTRTLDDLLYTTVWECRNKLKLDRVAIFLVEYEKGMMYGTFGTDIKGRITNERYFSAPLPHHIVAESTMDNRQPITILEDVELYHDGKPVGRGWNATICLWDGGTPIGWIACDNLLTGTPLQSYHRELLSLLGVTLSQHLAQRQAEERLKTLNYSLEQRVLQRTKELEEVNAKLEMLSLQDPLTGIANRRGFDRTLTDEWALAIRHGLPVTLLVIDIDQFKQYNDSYGHAKGDECLKAIADCLAEVERRKGALLARFGGEEFVYLLPGSNLHSARYIAEKALNAVRDLNITHESSTVADMVTISIGGKSITPSPHSMPDALFDAADQALYHAKQSGRNCCVVN